MKVLVYEELKDKKGIPYTKQHLCRRRRAGTFPEPINIGGRVAWLETEIDHWLEQRKAERDQNRADRRRRLDHRDKRTR